MTDGGRRGDSRYRSAAAPSRGLAPTGKPPYNTRGPLRRSLLAIAVQGCESARGPDADRHVKLLIQFAVEGSLSGAYSQSAVTSSLGRVNIECRPALSCNPGNDGAISLWASRLS
jgi:hypothetical protein